MESRTTPARVAAPIAVLTALLAAACNPRVPSSTTIATTLHFDPVRLVGFPAPAVFDRTEDGVTIVCEGRIVHLDPTTQLEYHLVPGRPADVDAPPTSDGHPVDNAIYVGGELLALVDGHLRIGERDLGPLPEGATAEVAPSGVRVDGELR